MLQRTTCNSYFFKIKINKRLNKTASRIAKRYARNYNFHRVTTRAERLDQHIYFSYL